MTRGEVVEFATNHEFFWEEIDDAIEFAIEEAERLAREKE